MGNIRGMPEAKRICTNAVDILKTNAVPLEDIYPVLTLKIPDQTKLYTVITPKNEDEENSAIL